MAVDMFLKLGDIKGEAQDKTHKEEIDVLAWSWGASNSGSVFMVDGDGGVGPCSKAIGSKHSPGPHAPTAP